MQRSREGGWRRGNCFDVVVVVGVRDGEQRDADGHVQRHVRGDGDGDGDEPGGYRCSRSG
jgi:hypothetical protein